MADLLATGTWTHDYPITYDKAKRLGLPVRADMPAEIMELMGLFRNRCAGSRQWSICPNGAGSEKQKRDRHLDICAFLFPLFLWVLTPSFSISSLNERTKSRKVSEPSETLPGGRLWRKRKCSS